MNNAAHTSFATRTLDAIRSHFWIRLVIIAAIVFCIVGALLPSETRSALGLKAASFLGYYFGLGIVIGGVAGWLTFSKKVWLWTTAIIIILCILIGFFSLPNFLEPWASSRTSDNAPKTPDIISSTVPPSSPKPEPSVAAAAVPSLPRPQTGGGKESGLRSVATVPTDASPKSADTGAGATDAQVADKVAREFYSIYSADGMAGINSRIKTCYASAEVTKRESELKDCFVFDFLATAIDVAFSQKINVPQRQGSFNQLVVSNDRLVHALKIVGYDGPKIGQRRSEWVQVGKLSADSLDALLPQ